MVSILPNTVVTHVVSFLTKEKLVADVASAISGIPIRLTEERWGHIVLQHPEVASLRQIVVQAVGQPERVLESSTGERMAIRAYEPGKYMVVIYLENPHNGFVVTAFLTRRTAWLDKRRQLWP